MRREKFCPYEVPTGTIKAAFPPGGGGWESETAVQTLTFALYQLPLVRPLARESWKPQCLLVFLLDEELPEALRACPPLPVPPAPTP